MIPSVINALLAGHDFILLGLRGQAKTRILRSLVTLLDERGAGARRLPSSTTIRSPRSPPTASAWSQEAGDDAQVEWMSREQRYNEKLATPDVSIADLLGDIDPIKAATRKLTFADPEVIHFGIIPRTNRGIFAINELPDLAPRIQVGLFNILEERDLQIRGFPVRIPLDIMMVFSANPEDYTNRGSIITPLKDRISSQILTHYPPDVRRGGGHHPPGGVDRARHLERRDPRRHPRAGRGDQPRGARERPGGPVLGRLGPRRHLGAGAAGLEPRAAGAGDEDNPVFPRLSDLQMLLPAITGKVEMVYEGEQQGAEVVARRLIGQAVKKVFDARFPEVGKEAGSGGEDDKGPYARMIRWFADGNAVTVSDEQPFADYEAEIYKVPGLQGARRRATARPPRSAPWRPRWCSRGSTSTSSWPARTWTARSATRRWSSSSSSSPAAAAPAAGTGGT